MVFPYQFLVSRLTAKRRRLKCFTFSSFSPTSLCYFPSLSLSFAYFSHNLPIHLFFVYFSSYTYLSITWNTMAMTLRWHSCSKEDYPHRRHKVPQACDKCRAKKMRCNGSKFLLVVLHATSLYFTNRPFMILIVPLYRASLRSL